MKWEKLYEGWSSRAYYLSDNKQYRIRKARRLGGYRVSTQPDGKCIAWVDTLREAKAAAEAREAKG